MDRSAKNELLLLLDDARVPSSLRSTVPLNWTSSDVALWLQNLGLSEESITKFGEEEVDGMSLFDMYENELKGEGLIPALGARKKFLRARLYLSTTYNITSLEKISANISSQQQQNDYSLTDNTFISGLLASESPGLLASKSPSAQKYKAPLPLHC